MKTTKIAGSEDRKRQDRRQALDTVEQKGARYLKHHERANEAEKEKKAIRDECMPLVKTYGEREKTESGNDVSILRFEESGFEARVATVESVDFGEDAEAILKKAGCLKEAQTLVLDAEKIEQLHIDGRLTDDQIKRILIPTSNDRFTVAPIKDDQR